MANETALLALLDVISQANDEGRWDQDYWAQKTACGTTCCAAGWKAISDGKKISWDNHMASFLEDGTAIEEYATEALGLNGAEAEYLFHYYENDFEEFTLRVKRVINGEVSW